MKYWSFSVYETDLRAARLIIGCIVGVSVLLAAALGWACGIG